MPRRREAHEEPTQRSDEQRRDGHGEPQRHQGRRDGHPGGACAEKLGEDQAEPPAGQDQDAEHQRHRHAAQAEGLDQTRQPPRRVGVGVPVVVSMVVPMSVQMTVGVQMVPVAIQMPVQMEIGVAVAIQVRVAEEVDVQGAQQDEQPVDDHHSKKDGVNDGGKCQDGVQELGQEGGTSSSPVFLGISRCFETGEFTIVLIDTMTSSGKAFRGTQWPSSC